MFFSYIIYENFQIRVIDKNQTKGKEKIMPYMKKVLLLKCAENSLMSNKSLSALARIEIENGVAEFHLSVINLPPLSTAFFALVVDQNKKVFEFDLGARPNSFAGLFNGLPSIEKGCAIGLYIVKDSLPQTLAFATDNPSSFCLADFKRLVAEKCLVSFKENMKNQIDCEQPVIPQEYNDEAVATENYFEIDKEIRQKLCSIKENQNENLWTENELSNSQSQEKAQERLNFFDCTQNETCACVSKEHQKLNTFFDQVKVELEDLFLRFPTEESLEKCFNDSKWVRINYSKEKYYVVGLIKEFGAEKYVCYGVPDTYSKTPPKELAGFCSFIPKSIFNPYGEGYWIMFQDALTGKCVHLE